MPDAVRLIESRSSIFLYLRNNSSTADKQQAALILVLKEDAARTKTSV